MKAGGDPTYQIFCDDNLVASALFNRFQREHEDAAGRSASTIRVNGQDVHLQVQHFETWRGAHYVAYSRKYQIEDGSWRTFQILRYKRGPASTVHCDAYWFKVFDGAGHKLAETSPPHDSARLSRVFAGGDAELMVRAALAACVGSAPAEDEKKECTSP